MRTLHSYAIFQKPESFGQAVKLIGFTRETPDPDHLDKRSHLALPIDNKLATEVAEHYVTEAPEKCVELKNYPKALIIEGSLWQAGVRAYGPFLNANEARQHGWKIESLYRTTIISLEHPDQEFVLGRTVNLPRLKGESALYHSLMQDLRDIKLPHGRCEPRKDMACTHCGAQERLDQALAEYRGARIVCS
jgi:hypothetical protein